MFPYPARIAKETGIFKKHGLNIDLVFIDASTRGIQSLLAGDLSFTEVVGTSAINGRIAGGDIAIGNGVVNTLPYYVIGKATIKSREELNVSRRSLVSLPRFENSRNVEVFGGFDVSRYSPLQR